MRRRVGALVLKTSAALAEQPSRRASDASGFQLVLVVDFLLN